MDVTQAQSPQVPPEVATSEEENLTLAPRLREAHIGLRSDLEVHRHLFRKKPLYVIRDPVSLQCHQVEKAEYEILAHLTDKKSLGQIFEELLQAGLLQPEQEEEFYEFVVGLHRMAFLQLPIADDKNLYRRYLNKQQSRRRARLMSFLFLQIPLINPDTFLNRTVHWFRPLYTQWFFFVWLGLMAIGGGIAAARWDDLTNPTVNLLSARNLAALWVLLIVLKVFHEFGHAFACKVRGGYVSEMGIYLIAGTPCAYVDVTASWGFTRKLDRIVVGLGGMYFESMVAFVALLVWALTDSPFWQSLSYNTFFLASLVTVLMNINPLMRFDGYYILSDLLEVPNLRSRSQQYVLNILKRLLMGIRPADEVFPDASIPMKMALITFGVASSLYRVAVILGIAGVIATKAFLVGLGIAGFYICNELLKRVRRVTWYLWQSPEAASVRARAIAVSIFLLVGVPVGLFALPIPVNVEPSGQLARSDETVLRAAHAGFVQAVGAESGQWVQPGTELLRLENRELDEWVLEADAAVKAQEVQIKALADDPSARRDWMEHRQNLAAIQEDFHQRQLQQQELTVIAPHEGRVLDWFGPEDVGRYVTPGQPLGKLVAGDWVVQVLMNQRDVAYAHPQTGQPVKLKFPVLPGRTFAGVIDRIAPAGTHQIALTALTSLGEGEIPVNHLTRQAQEPYYRVEVRLADADAAELRYGMTARIRLKTPARPLGSILHQKFLRFLQSLYKE